LSPNTKTCNPEPLLASKSQTLSLTGVTPWISNGKAARTKPVTSTLAALAFRLSSSFLPPTVHENVQTRLLRLLSPDHRVPQGAPRLRGRRNTARRWTACPLTSTRTNRPSDV